jgi:hypothetical protein
MNKTDSNPNQYVKRGNTFMVAAKENLDVHPVLPPGNYIVKYDEMNHFFFLEKAESFELPKQIYGNAVAQSDRIIETFKKRPFSTGVFLEGEKGSGKTMLAKLLSHKVNRELSGATLIVNIPFVGNKFNKFIQDIQQPCVVLFDEFEKVYHETEKQDQLLTLLDGVFPSKKLFVLTCNDKYKVNSHFKNRPGRLFYMLSFDGLTKEFIHEFCEKNLKPDLHAHIPQVLAVAGAVYKFNFDMLNALVEEMNRYDESPKDAVQMLNIKPDDIYRDTFILTYTDPDGVVVPKDQLEDTEWSGSLSTDNVFIYNCRTYPKVGRKKEVMEEIIFTQDDFIEINSEDKTVHFENDKGYTLVLKKKVKKAMITNSYDSYLA